MGTLTKEELYILNRQRFQVFNYMDKTLWTRAFDEYNEDHPKDRPLGLHCRSCYMKVFSYLKLKYAALLNN